MVDQIVTFLRRKDFIYEGELGRGACGRTVLLRDDVIDERFVCKKFSPAEGLPRAELFENFVREVKILHKLHHPNLVRVFNYYLYPEQHAGFILMEVVEGPDIEEYLLEHPDKFNQIFSQVVAGFHYLERHGILHRDIRPNNIMVSKDGVAKIIDFGFGKSIESMEDFDKSISLNWWCQPPLEFSDRIYDFSSEVYFVGKLFERILAQASAVEFSFSPLLERMCATDPRERLGSFLKVRQEMLSGRIKEMEFTATELAAYRSFSSDLRQAVSKIEQDAKYHEDVGRVLRSLEECYRRVMLEELVPSNVVVINCFVNGGYYYSNTHGISVESLKEFLNFFKMCSDERRSIVLSNINSKLDSVPRYGPDPLDDEIPF